jgi:hypothetical protein
MSPPAKDPTDTVRGAPRGGGPRATGPEAPPISGPSRGAPLPVTQDPAARLFVATIPVRIVVRAATADAALARAEAALAALGNDVAPDGLRIVDRA